MVISSHFAFWVSFALKSGASFPEGREILGLNFVAIWLLDQQGQGLSHIISHYHLKHLEALGKRFEVSGFDLAEDTEVRSGLFKLVHFDREEPATRIDAVIDATNGAPGHTTWILSSDPPCASPLAL